MPDSGEIRAISWSSTLGFVRLFRSFTMALAPMRLSVCLAGLIAMYVAGRTLDGLWTALSADNGAIRALDAGHEVSEVSAFSSMSAADFDSWRKATTTARHAAELAAVMQFTDAKTEKDARERLADSSAVTLIAAGGADQLDAATALVQERRTAALSAIQTDTSMTATQRAERKSALMRASDCLRFALAGVDAASRFSLEERARAAETLIAADAQLSAAQRADALAKITAAAARQMRIAELRRFAPRGPFMALLQHEVQCLAGCVEGMFAARLGVDGAAHSGRPSMLGSIFSAANGVIWLITQRPFFTLFFGVVFFCIYAFFGGALARMIAIEAARAEYVSLGSAFRFAREKFRDFLMIPLILAGAALLLWLVPAIGAILGAIPWIGPTITGVLFFIGLIMGVALSLWLVASALGFPLMWPTIAVEGSDSFDAMSRGISYVGQRCWLSVFYYFITIAYGGLCFVLVRVIAMVGLKVAHSSALAGMSMFGWWSSSLTDTVARMDAIWHMPAWADLTLLPSVTGAPFWGVFATAPLSGSEWLAAWFFRIWIYMLVGAVGAFVLNFWLSSCTQMYYLLRRDVDATDFTEIFIDDDPDDLFGSRPPAAETSPRPAEAAKPPGTALPVLNAPANH